VTPNTIGLLSNANCSKILYTHVLFFAVQLTINHIQVHGYRGTHPLGFPSLDKPPWFESSVHANGRVCANERYAKNASRVIEEGPILSSSELSYTIPTEKPTARDETGAAKWHREIVDV
jgi:hypothetical protein